MPWAPGASNADARQGDKTLGLKLKNPNQVQSLWLRSTGRCQMDSRYQCLQLQKPRSIPPGALEPRYKLSLVLMLRIPFLVIKKLFSTIFQQGPSKNPHIPSVSPLNGLAEPFAWTAEPSAATVCAASDHPLGGPDTLHPKLGPLHPKP